MSLCVCVMVMMMVCVTVCAVSVSLCACVCLCVCHCVCLCAVPAVCAIWGILNILVEDAGLDYERVYRRVCVYYTHTHIVHRDLKANYFTR